MDVVRISCHLDVVGSCHVARYGVPTCSGYLRQAARRGRKPPHLLARELVRRQSSRPATSHSARRARTRPSAPNKALDGNQSGARMRLLLLRARACHGLRGAMSRPRARPRPRLGGPAHHVGEGSLRSRNQARAPTRQSARTMNWRRSARRPRRVAHRHVRAVQRRPTARGAPPRSRAATEDCRGGA